MNSVGITSEDHLSLVGQLGTPDGQKGWRTWCQGARKEWAYELTKEHGLPQGMCRTPASLPTAGPRPSLPHSFSLSFPELLFPASSSPFHSLFKVKDRLLLCS